MANHALDALEVALDNAVAAAVDAQAAVDRARARAGIAKSAPAFVTAARLVAELSAAYDRHNAESRIEMREMMKAVITDCRIRWDRSYQPTGLEKAMMGWPAAFKALDKTHSIPSAADNVVKLQTAEQIIAAGRRRRGEET
ncbi:hypothetical protein UP09_22545 [Bradyrhizobium sp. LTSP885]|uniref:hypothetical protein n=1 Tax=Bradyrhizobium sp. LTSP885 TaxID=1619232 RepID=UPI0005CA7ED7|nr:hypothetical protein [Bradyrhizobium sp. LTSP885]KJC40288.1 hypothetical protein UP09_22545 [Bradyrhizobium sp. LTSP885]